MTRVDDLLRSNIIAVLRGSDTARAVEVTGALLEGGIRAIEITMDSPTPGDTIRRISSRFDDALVGAGTVHTETDVNVAVEAGAAFLLSPALNESVVRAGRERNVITVPGCLTPSEIMQAYRSEADAVKLFPAGELGPSYLRSIRGPLVNLPVIPTGGVSPENVRAFVEAGASAVGVGSYLTGPSDSGPPDTSTLISRARQLNEAFPDDAGY